MYLLGVFACEHYTSRDGINKNVCGREFLTPAG